ncbi:MAG: hypothetical protein HRU41_00790 [Saprospiraceae bacterium]|nr:hypothetical protein [Saprospiraceae bacterium]
MNLQQAKILLEKINSLYKSISMDGEIATIERDLMLSYIRQLYETFHQMDENGTVASPKSRDAKVKQNPDLEITNEPAVKPPVKKYKPPRIIEIPDTVKETPPAPKKQAPPPPPPKPAPKSKPAPKPEPPKAPPAPKPAPTATGSSNPKIKKLFVFKEAKELSEKLSAQPIKDLTKSMAINDRLLYTNDLFGKDNNALNAALKQLNGLSSMDQAQPMLEELAEKYDWTSEEKTDTAISLIKLVRRRYL